MNTTRLLLAASALTVLSACAAERKPAPQAPLPPPRPATTLTPAPPPPADWRDAAPTPGTWTYAGGSAAFGTVGAAPLLSLRCDGGAASVVLSRTGSAPGPVPLTVTTTSINRTFTVAPATTPAASGAAPAPSALTVALGARDPILDAVAFSRGRFMVEVPGLPTLYLPAWPEIGRVIEDCR